jgi:integrase
VAGKPFTDTLLNNLVVGQQAGDAGCRGLRATRNSNGTVLLWYRYKDPVTGKLLRHSIGKWGKRGDQWSIAMARSEIERLKQVRASNPSDLKKPVTTTVTGTLQDVWDHYCDTLRGKSPKYYRNTVDLLPLCATPKERGMLVAEMTMQHVLSMHQRQANKGTLVQGGNFLNTLRRAIEMAMLSGLIPDGVNPATQAKDRLRIAGVKLGNNKRTRVLTDNELTQLFTWLHSTPPPFARKHYVPLMLTLRTGCRSGEAISAQWDDFDLEQGTWNLKDTDTKTGIGRTIILPKQVVSMLQEHRAKFPDTKYLAQKQKVVEHLPQKTLTERMWVLKREDRMLDIPHWRPHDLRRTCRTGLSKIGCPHEVAEAALGHVMGGVVGVYNLHRYEAEVGAWLQKWNDYLDALR